MALRTVGVRLAAEVSGYRNGLRAASQSTKDLVGEMDKAAKAGRLDAVADQAAAMGVGLAAAFGGVIAVTAQFDKQMSEVGAVSGATAAELDELRAAALEAGKATSFSATEAAKAQAELAKAGLDSSQILGGALTGALDLAAAGTLDLAEAADIAAKTMNVFQLEGKDVGHIADVLAAAANKSATDVHEMGEALKMGGLASKAAGMSLEETVGTLAAFADRALNGSDAGTSLKTALMMLQAPTDKAAGLMEELGIQAYDAQGQFIGTAKLAGQLQTALGDLTQEQRNAALAQIFGADAMRAANVLFEVGEQGIREYTEAVDDQGAAADVAREKMDNLAGDIEKLKGSLETLAIESGTGASAGLRKLVQGADALVAQFSALNPAVSQTIIIAAGLGGVLLLGLAAWVKTRAAIALAVVELNAVGPAGARAAVGLQAATKWAGRAGVAFVALEVASAIFAQFRDDAADVDKLAKSLKELGDTGQVAGEMQRLFGGDLRKVADDLAGASGWYEDFNREVVESIPLMRDLREQVFGVSFSSHAEDVKALDEALAQLAGEDVESARAAMARLSQAASRTGVDFGELQKLLPNATQAIRDAEKASDPLARHQQKVAETAELMASGWAQATSDGKSLVDVFNELNGVAIAWAEAEIDVEEAGRKMKDALDESNGSLDVHTDKGAAAKTSILGFAKATADATQAKYDETGSLEEATAVYNHYRAQLVATLTQMTGNKKKAEELADQYLSMPKNIATNAKFNTSSADAGIKGFIKKIQGLDGKVITVYTRLTPLGEYHPGAGTATRRWGGITEHAQTGLLREAAVYSPMGPARYAFAEPATGGEAFIPKYGDRDRSLGILDKAASWYGMQVGQRDDRWYGMQPMMATRQTVLVKLIPPDVGASAGLMGELVRGLRYEVLHEGGGDVQVALGS